MSSRPPKKWTALEVFVVSFLFKCYGNRDEAAQNYVKGFRCPEGVVRTTRAAVEKLKLIEQANDFEVMWDTIWEDFMSQVTTLSSKMMIMKAIARSYLGPTEYESAFRILDDSSTGRNHPSLVQSLPRFDESVEAEEKNVRTSSHDSMDHENAQFPRSMDTALNNQLFERFTTLSSNSEDPEPGYQGPIPPGEEQTEKQPHQAQQSGLRACYASPEKVEAILHSVSTPDYERNVRERFQGSLASWMHQKSGAL